MILRLLKTGATIAIIVVVAEGLLSIFGAYFAPTVVRSENAGYRFVPNLSAARKDFESGLLLRFETNRFGARDREWPLNADRREKRIAVIGNSFVEAASVPARQRFTNLLERRLVARRIRATVMNFGVGGQNIINYLDQVRSLERAFKPDLFIVAIHNGSNFFHDRQTTFSSTDRIDYISTDKGVTRSITPLTERDLAVRGIKKVLRRSWLVRAAHSSMVLAKENFPKILHLTTAEVSCSPPYTARSSFSDRAFALTEAIIEDISRLVGNRLIILQVPDFLQLTRPTDCAWDKPENRLARFAREKGIDLVQLLGRFRRSASATHFTGPHLKAGGHLNRHGHEITAGALADAVQRHPGFQRALSHRRLPESDPAEKD